jgi:hypothetical protein
MVDREVKMSTHRDARPEAALTLSRAHDRVA